MINLMQDRLLTQQPVIASVTVKTFSLFGSDIDLNRVGYRNVSPAEFLVAPSLSGRDCTGTVRAR